MTPGIFHRPKGENAPNAFESAKRGAGTSTILADNPSMLHRKRGPATPVQPFSLGKVPVSAPFTTYSKAKPSSAKSAKLSQRGHITTSANCWLGAILIAAGFALAQQLDITLTGPSDWEAAQAVAEEREALASREWAARQVCGREASFVWVSDTQLQCQTKHGRKVGKPQLVTVAGFNAKGLP